MILETEAPLMGRDLDIYMMTDVSGKVYEFSASHEMVNHVAQEVLTRDGKEYPKDLKILVKREDKP